MRTKFDLEQSVWYLDVFEGKIIEAKVTGIAVDAEGESCRVKRDEGEIVIPAIVLFSSKEGCRAHYLAMFR